MSNLTRVLGAVTLRRVLAFLLIAGFAPEISAAISWLASTAWGLGSASTLRACLLVGLRLGMEAALIYLPLRGLRRLAERRHLARTATWTESTPSEQGSPTWPQSSGFDSAATDAPRGGGENGHGPDRS